MSHSIIDKRSSVLKWDSWLVFTNFIIPTFGRYHNANKEFCLNEYCNFSILIESIEFKFLENFGIIEKFGV